MILEPGRGEALGLDVEGLEGGAAFISIFPFFAGSIIIILKPGTKIIIMPAGGGKKNK